MSSSSRIGRPEHVVALDLHLGGQAEQRQHRRQEHRGGLAAPPGPDEPADCLGEEQRRRRRGRVDADRQPRHVDALADHPHRDHPPRVALGELRDLAAGRLLVRQHDGGPLAADPAEQGGVRPGRVLVGRDHQPASVGHVPADLAEPAVGRLQHGRHPGAVDVEGGTQRLRRLVLGQRLAEPGRDLVAGPGTPRHLAGVRHEQHRPHHVVGQRLGVPVGVVGDAARHTLAVRARR